MQKIKIWQIKKYHKFFCLLGLEVFTFCFLFLTTRPLFAQNEISDYQYQNEKYREAYQVYLKTREAYLKYQTLTSQTDFNKASQDFLYLRAKVLRNYFQVIKKILRETVDIEPNQRQALILALDREIDSLEAYENQLQNLQQPTLNDLWEISLRVERRVNFYKKLAYQSLANIILGRMRSLNSESVAINFLLEEKIKNNPDKEVTLLNQWLQTVRDKTYQSQKNLEKAENYLELLNKSETGQDAYNFYLKIQEELGKAKAGFLENLNFQREILITIKE